MRYGTDTLSWPWPCLQGLLTEYGKSLANLTHLDVGACRWGREGWAPGGYRGPRPGLGVGAAWGWQQA